MSKKRLGAVAAIAAALFLLFAAYLYFAHQTPTLVMQDNQNGTVYLSLPLDDDRIFSVSYTHSVNKSLVEEYYQVSDDGTITLIKARQHIFGAGVATTLTDDQYLTYDDDGYMVINNINRPIPSLVYKVGTTSDHILHIGANQWHLKDYAPELTSVKFTIR